MVAGIYEQENLPRSDDSVRERPPATSTGTVPFERLSGDPDQPRLG